MAVPLVLFDLDGTLLDGSGLPEAMRRTCVELAREVPGATADDLVAANTAAWRQIWPEAEEDYLLGGVDVDRVGADAWRRTLRAVGGDPALVATAQRIWRREERAAFRLFDDALPALDRLAATGVRTGMVTNGASSVQRLKLRTVGLERRFDPLVIPAEVGERKPGAAILGIAMHRASAVPGETWFVGDNLWHDIAPAAAAGLRTAWLDRHGMPLDAEWPRPAAVLQTLDDLDAALAREPRYVE